ncbi:SDR family oxidoreductase [Terrabacter carboxydivorans]|uniref:NAD(P)-binding domain-containing protein n=1 Tax=Terrabacter carboxydivorans TaxID=619730 RepID=A0ABP5YK15_9MICO
MIAVIGGTGRLGRLVTERLVDQGEQVRVVARSAPDRRVPGAHFAAADLRDPSTLPPALDGADVVVAAAHGMDPGRGESPAEIDRDGNVALIDVASGRGTDVVLLSVVGAAADHPLELFRMKWAAEQHLRASSASWTIVRASAFAEMWLELLGDSARGGKGPQVFGAGDNPINFVSVDDVAVAAARAATDRSLRGRTIEVGGEDLTLNELARLVRPDLPPRHVPRAALRVLGQLARPVRPSFARLARAAATMDSTDLRFEASTGREAYPWLPGTSVRELAQRGGS